MKLLLLFCLIGASNVFATGGFNCSSKDGNVSVSGTVGAGSVLLSNIYITHSDLGKTISLPLSMKWIDYSKQEIKALSYDAVEDVERIKLVAENGKGVLSLNLVDLVDDIFFVDIPVMCELE